MYSIPNQTSSNQHNNILADRKFGPDYNPINLGVDINGLVLIQIVLILCSV